MRVGEVIRRETVLVGEAVQIGQRRIGDHVTEIGVFLDDKEDMAKAHGRRGRRRGHGRLSHAAGQD